jgi:hypothetical protein
MFIRQSESEAAILYIKNPNRSISTSLRKQPHLRFVLAHCTGWQGAHSDISRPLCYGGFALVFQARQHVR